MTSRHIWTTEENAILAGMKRAGLTTAQIAKRLGLDTGTVKRQSAKLRTGKSLLAMAGRFQPYHAPQVEVVDDLSILLDSGVDLTQADKRPIL